MLNLPNALASIRIILAPIMLWVMINPSFTTNMGLHQSWVMYFSALIFVLASVTDFFDGYIARELDQKTTLGAILDPLADKMLMLAAFFGLMLIDMVSVWAIYIILVRELFITGLRTAAISEGLDISASFMGKMKTVVQMIAVGFLMMEWSFGEEILWIAVALTIYSGYEYIRDYAKAKA